MADIVLRLGAVGLLNEAPGVWRRVVFEKPFGHDLASALALNRQLASGPGARRRSTGSITTSGRRPSRTSWRSASATASSSPIWNRRYIDHVQITVAETVGVEDRGGYYDRAGRPAGHGAEPPVPAARAHRHGAADLVLGRRRAGRAGEGAARHPSVHRGRRAVGCRARAVRPRAWIGARRSGLPSEAKVRRPRSTTETYVALRLSIDNWRWAGVPFYLRTGKRLPARVIGDRDPVQARAAAAVPTDRRRRCLNPNLLLVRIQPDEGISLQFQAKVPGRGDAARHREDGVQLRRLLRESPETGYETLLYDCMTGDQTLFHRADMVDAGWRVVEPILDVVGAKPDDLLYEYSAFSWGPPAADALLARDGRAWRRPGP